MLRSRVEGNNQDTKEEPIEISDDSDDSDASIAKMEALRRELDNMYLDQQDDMSDDDDSVQSVEIVKRSGRKDARSGGRKDVRSKDARSGA